MCQHCHCCVIWENLDLDVCVSNFTCMTFTARDKGHRPGIVFPTHGGSREKILTRTRPERDIIGFGRCHFHYYYHDQNSNFKS